MSESESKPWVLSLQYFCQLALCVYGSRQSYVAITNLRKYEETTKKLAKWSTEADNQLWKTRKTQGAGALTILAGLIVSTNLAFFRGSFYKWVRLGLPPVMLAAVMASRAYIKKFWAPAKDKDGKDVGTKFPLLPNMESYNEAVEKTEELLKTLQYLEYSYVSVIAVAWLTGN